MVFFGGGRLLSNWLPGLKINLHQSRLAIAIVAIGVIERSAERPILRDGIPRGPGIAGDIAPTASVADIVNRHR